MTEGFSAFPVGNGQFAIVYYQSWMHEILPDGITIGHVSGLVNATKILKVLEEIFE